MKIRIADDSDQSCWDEYVQNHPDGLAYHRYAWQKAVKTAYCFDSYMLLAEEGGETCGILPLVSFRLPLKAIRMISLPYCDAGGILADSKEVAEALWVFLDEKGQEYEIRSAFPLPLGLANQTDKVRMLLELPDSSEALLAGLKAKLRSQVKKPTRDGLTAVLGGEEHIETFYRLFSRNMRDLGSPVHSFAWIKSVVANYKENCRVAVVYMPDGEPAAAGIVLLNNRSVSIPWASSLREHNRYNPNMLLYWTFLSFAADNGYRYFDFGRSTPGEGTYRFKQQWGALPMPLYWYRSVEKDKAETATQASTSKRDLICSLWQKLPLAVANELGPRLRKYISL